MIKKIGKVTRTSRLKKRKGVKPLSASSSRGGWLSRVKTGRVLNEESHDPKKQIPVDTIVERIMVLAQVLSEKVLYPYQIKLGSRIIESILLHDSETITSLMSRQAGKTETLGAVMAACAIMLPLLARMYPECWMLNITDDNGVDRGFRSGFKVGIYAPKQDQSQITFDRIKKAFDTDSCKQIMEEAKLHFEVCNGNRVEVSNGSRIICDSASENSKIEGETHHCVVAEEAQDISDMKLKKSIYPMVSSTLGTIIMIGTAAAERCTFYDQIKINERMQSFGAKQNHFFFPYTVCAEENSLYKKTVRKQMIQLGADSDEFRMSYLGEWIFERGMFVTQGQLYDDGCARYYGPGSQLVTAQYEIPNTFRYYSLVAGIDWGAANDSTVLSLMAVNWRHPIEDDEVYDAEGQHRVTLYRKHLLGLWDFAGDNYEVQFLNIVEILRKFTRVEKVIMDSNACGRPLYDRFCVQYAGSNIEIEPFNFTPKLKSDGYKTFHGDIVTGRFTFPCSKEAQEKIEFRRFTTQMLDLRKTYKNGNLCVAHPEEKGAHDDYCDSVMLANYGASRAASSNLMEMSASNPFI